MLEIHQHHAKFLEFSWFFLSFFLYPWSSPVFFSQFSDVPKSFSPGQRVPTTIRQSGANGFTGEMALGFLPFFNGKFLDQNREISMKSPWNPRETWRVSKSCDWLLEVWTIWIDLTWLTFVKRVCRCCFSVWLPCIGRREVPRCSPQERHIREKYGWIRLLGLSCYIGRVCIKCVCSAANHISEFPSNRPILWMGEMSYPPFAEEIAGTPVSPLVGLSPRIGYSGIILDKAKDNFWIPRYPTVDDEFPCFHDPQLNNWWSTVTIRSIFMRIIILLMINPHDPQWQNPNNWWSTHFVQIPGGTGTCEATAKAKLLV